MSVDVGIDISAIKDNKFFGIQVKTSNSNKFDVYNFHIRKVSFERHNQGNIFYILVLRQKENKFVILPSSEVERKIKEGAVYGVNNQTGPPPKFNTPILYN
jgi:Holliday junction resolvase